MRIVVVMLFFAGFDLADCLLILKPVPLRSDTLHLFEDRPALSFRMQKPASNGQNEERLANEATVLKGFNKPKNQFGSIRARHLPKHQRDQPGHHKKRCLSFGHRGDEHLFDHAEKVLGVSTLGFWHRATCCMS